MSTLDDVTKSNAELGGMVKSAMNGKGGGSIQTSVSKNYNTTVDDHMDTSEKMHEKLENH